MEIPEKGDKAEPLTLFWGREKQVKDFTTKPLKKLINIVAAEVTRRILPFGQIINPPRYLGGYGYWLRFGQPSARFIEL